MNIERFTFVFALLCALVGSFAAFAAPQTDNYMLPGGASWQVGGTLNIKNGASFQLSGTALALDELQALDNSLKVTFMDDFLGDAIDDAYDVRAGAGTSADAISATIDPAVPGVSKGSSGTSTTLTFANNGSSMTHALNWQANQGGLFAETRVKLTSIEDVSFFFGLTDAVASGTFEMPATLSGGTLTSNADNFVGATFDTSATTDVIHFVGSAATVDVSDSTVTAPVADTYNTLRIEVDTSGNADLYIDGTLAAELTSAVGASTPLTPVFAIQSHVGTVRKSWVADYMKLQQDRE